MKYIRKKSLLKKKTRAKKPVVSTAVKAYVNKKIMVNEEPKQSFFNILSKPLTILDPLAFSDLFTYDITQTAFLQQGANQAQRIGNRITPSVLKLRGCISIINSTITANMYFRIVVLCKKTGVDSTAGSYGNLYQLGGTAAAPTGTLLDLMRSINTDFYKVVKQKIILVGSSDAATSVMPGNRSTTTQLFTMDLSKHCPRLQYNDGTTFPQNWGLYCVVIPVNANGVSTSNGQLLAFQITMESEMTYRDA